MPMFVLISDILCICMVLICCLCFITTLFMREEDQVKQWPLILLAIRKVFCYFACCFTFRSYTKFYKILVTNSFCFVNLQAVGAWQIPQLVGDAKRVFFCCMLFEECGDRTTFSSPRVRYKPFESPLWRKLVLLHHSALGVPKSGI
jgi:hypothetical protein